VESLERRIKASLAVIISSVGLTACGGAVSAEEGTKKSTEILKNNEIQITQEYFSEGARITKFEGERGRAFDAILSYCDGYDLIDVTEASQVNAGSGVSRSIRHRACNDQVLSE
jgi:hypothetical protein